VAAFFVGGERATKPGISGKAAPAFVRCSGALTSSATYIKRGICGCDPLSCRAYCFVNVESKLHSSAARGFTVAQQVFVKRPITFTRQNLGFFNQPKEVLIAGNTIIGSHI
jgi:hypothetical protein